jgi:hypothetical protein
MLSKLGHLWWQFYLALVVFGFCPSAYASGANWHGFASQGIIQGQDSNFVNDEGKSSLQLTELGLNGSMSLSPTLRVAGQLVYLNGGNRYPEGGRLDYLFLDWKVVSSANWQIDLHLGRYKNFHWLYSAIRDVPHTRPSIVLPQSVYFDSFRDVAVGSDGLAVLASTANGSGEWDINWSYGQSAVSRKQMYNFFSDAATGEIKQDFVHQFSTFWRPKLSNSQWGISLLDSDFIYTAGVDDLLISGLATTRRLMLSYRFESERWDFAAEFMQERVIFKNLIFAGFSNDNVGEGGYLQSRYFINSDTTALFRIDLMDTNNKDRSGFQLQASSKGLVPDYFAYQDQATIGLSWEFSENWRLQGEFHRVKGTARLAPILIPDTQINTDKYWNIWALHLMYWF